MRAIKHQYLHQTPEAHYPVSKAILSFVIIGTIPSGLYVYFRAFQPSYMFSALILMGIIIVVNILRARVRDSIGCVQESMASFLTILVTIIATPLATAFQLFNTEAMASFTRCNGVTSSVIVATIALYIPIRLINKTRSERVYEVSTSQQIELPSRSAEPIEAISAPTGMAISLQSFLKDYDNYKLFAQYLSRCFALESLLFVERVLILYHMICKYKRMDNMQKSDQTIPQRKLYKLKFDYLSAIYIEMGAMIQKGIGRSDESEIIKYKHGILDVAKVIYTQFCRDDASTQINVSSHVSKVLHRLFENKDDKALSNQFESYDELLLIFDQALDETWMVCQSVYEFRFKMYIKTLYK